MAYSTSWSPSATPAAGKAVDNNWFLQLMANFVALGSTVGSQSWTPVLTSTGGGAPVYASQVGTYVQLGKLVFLQCFISLSSLGTLAAGNVTITGLPAAAANLNPITVPYWVSMTTAFVHIGGYVSGSTINMVTATGAVTSVNPLTKADFSASSQLILGGSYITT